MGATKNSKLTKPKAAKAASVESINFDKLSLNGQHCPTCGQRSSWGFPWNKNVYCWKHVKIPKMITNGSNANTVNLHTFKPLIKMVKQRPRSNSDVSNMTQKEKDKFVKNYEAHIKECEELHKTFIEDI